MSDIPKSLKVGHSDTANRPHFDNGSDDFWTSRRPPETPDSWSPRAALMGLRPGSVSGRVVEENGFGNQFRQPEKQPDKTTHLTIRRWFSFSLSNNQIASPKCVGFSKIKVSTQFQLGGLCWSFIDFGVDGFFLLLQSCLQKQLKAILFLNYAKPPG